MQNKSALAEARALRAREKLAREAEHARLEWEKQLQACKVHMHAASETLKTLTQKDVRALWLVLAVFELEERNAAKGQKGSVRTAVLDSIAPRVRDGSYGVSGFSARMALAYPALLRSSGNGYLYLTDLSYALVQVLRRRYTELLQIQERPQSVMLAGIGDLPCFRWR